MLPVPDLADWPDVNWVPGPSAKKVNLDTVTRTDIAGWKSGETLLLSGRLLTGRDAAHGRIADLLTRGADWPPGLDFTNRFI